MREAYSQGESVRVLYGRHTRFDDLPAPYQGLLGLAARQSFYASSAWLGVLAATTLREGEELRLATAATDDGVWRVLSSLEGGDIDVRFE